VKARGGKEEKIGRVDGLLRLWMIIGGHFTVEKGEQSKCGKDFSF
jgi:hypothetical protein